MYLDVHEIKDLKDGNDFNDGNDVNDVIDEFSESHIIDNGQLDKTYSETIGGYCKASFSEKDESNIRKKKQVHVEQCEQIE